MTTLSTLARLAKELNGYANHSQRCYYRATGGEYESDCTCGLTALQQQLAEELAKEGPDDV